MTEEELREKMAELILDFQTPNDNEIWDEYTLTDQILTLIREAGYVHKSTIPNATICPKCNEMHWIR